jgi:Protein of unknown function (DUF1822)
MLNTTYEFALPLPITQVARQTAQTFAQHLPATKAQQIRLNTLAVLAMQNYFQLMEIPTRLSDSDSWNPVLRVCADVADLEIPGIGRLECRPVLSDAKTCPIPPETWDDRIGYVVVEINEEAQEARLLGFVPAAAEVEDLPLSDLRSPEDLLEHLYALKTAPASSISPSIPAAAESSPSTPVLEPIGRSLAPVQQALTNLGNWLSGEIAQTWQAVEDLVNPAQLGTAFRRGSNTTARGASSVLRAQSLSLAPELDQPVALVVQLKPGMDNQAEVAIALFPTTQPSLPANLKISVVNPVTNAVMDTGSARQVLILENCTTGDRFSVRISLNTTTLSRDFVI